jgi:hypothetical protein
LLSLVTVNKQVRIVRLEGEKIDKKWELVDDKISDGVVMAEQVYTLAGECVKVFNI